MGAANGFNPVNWGKDLGNGLVHNDWSGNNTKGTTSSPAPNMQAPTQAEFKRPESDFSAENHFGMNDETYSQYKANIDADATKYQRAMADLKKAGINPMIAFANNQANTQAPITNYAQYDAGKTSSQKDIENKQKDKGLDLKELATLFFIFKTFI